MRKARGILRSHRPIVGPTVLVLGLLIASPLHATRVRSLGLADMADRAGRIFAGRCTSRSVAVDPATGLQITTYVFAVTDPIKGVGRGPTAVRIPGTPDRPLLFGLPSFEIGEEALVILYPESGAGFSAPIGLGQGRFRVARRPDGSALAMNGRGNDRLLRDVPGGLLKGRGLDRDARGPIDLQRLAGLLRDLAKGGGP